MDHLAAGGLREPDHVHRLAPVVLHEDDVGGLDCHIGRGEGRGVVYAAAHYGHELAFRLQLRDHGALFVGRYLRNHGVQAQLLRHPVRTVSTWWA
ncbi:MULTISPECIES: hypothetical protein [Salinibacter]|uniref:hypothetical protein n=1 Tax=Salinibacter TaxID=146918 RepID=UPI0021E949BF|nr:MULTISPECIES: hypothetical protein [Salinibacter]